ncbi:MAG: hypothetical protein V2A34_09015, partial [Lentisphaerota bacterium]
MGCLLWPCRAFALGPHEIALLVNADSPRSIAIANYYAHMRGIPAANVVFVTLPERVLKPAGELSPEEFRRFIYDPVTSELNARKVNDHILFWAYSADFPVRIQTDPPMSLQGITFTRGVLPPADLVRKGLFLSRLFIGPDKPGGAYAVTRSLEQYADLLGTNYPLPSMSLAYFGARGLTLDENLQMLLRGRQSDHTRPDGPVYFLTSPDIRSTCRAWQYPEVSRDLEAMGVATLTTQLLPRPDTRLSGLMMGNCWAQDAMKGNMLPGCWADNITSLGAVFDHWDHTKISDWIRSGATAAEGSVTEPYAIWTKFPHARLFVHAASGCALAESLYQAIFCPLQLMLLGDPLSAPWQEDATLRLAEKDFDAKTGMRIFQAVISPEPRSLVRYMFLLDGQVIQSGLRDSCPIDPSALQGGYHELRAAGYLPGTVRAQCFNSLAIDDERNGRHVALESPGGRVVPDLQQPLLLKVRCGEKPAACTLFAGQRAVPGTYDTDQQIITADPLMVGSGPIDLRVEAVFSDGAIMRSAPIGLDVAWSNQPPPVPGLAVTTNVQHELVLAPVIQAGANKLARICWMEEVLGEELPEGSVVKPVLTGPWQWQSGRLWRPPSDKENELHTAALFPASGYIPAELRADLAVAPAWVPLIDQKAGLIFNVR